jgi:Predicted hydrolase of the alpha/beta superfamily
VVFEGRISSSILGAERMVRIYVPPSYEKDLRRRYPVLYLQDGQNAFSTVGTNVAFGWGNWELDKTADRLSAEKKMQEIIMVAIDCSAERYLDYRGPAYPDQENGLKQLERPPAPDGHNTRFRNYSRFLIEELKPKIDREYRTRSSPAHTAVMGSSLGGICSLAMAWEHPETFGLAASLSGAFQVERRTFLLHHLGAYRDKAKPIRIYLDSGIVDFAGGDDGREDTERVVAELRRIGYREGRNLRYYVDAQPLGERELEHIGLRPDKWKEAQTSQHNEFYWRLRVWRALSFLFPGK